MRNHSSVHFAKTNHPIVMNIKRTPKVRLEDNGDQARPKKLTKLEIKAEEPESERYDFKTRLECRICNVEIPQSSGNVFILAREFV